MIGRVTRAKSRRNKVDKVAADTSGRKQRIVHGSVVFGLRLHTATSESRGIVIAKLILSPVESPSYSPSPRLLGPVWQSQDDSAALITPRGWPSSGGGGGLVDTSTSVKSLRTFVRGKRDLYRSPNSPLFFAARCT